MAFSNICIYFMNEWVLVIFVLLFLCYAVPYHGCASGAAAQGANVEEAQKKI